MLSERALNDAKAVSLAEAFAVANQAAQRAGVFRRPVRRRIEERTAEDGTTIWRINFLPVTQPGIFLRGGDFVVEVSAADGAIRRVLWGQ